MRLRDLRVNLLEGGNVFKGEDGKVQTKRIDQADVGPTVMWLEKITELPLISNMLGTTGKKTTSGDLDLAVDQSKHGKDDLVKKLSDWASKQGLDPKDWVRKSGISVHFKTPIKGDPGLGFVQTDFMFGEDIDFMKFGLFAGSGSQFTGADRNLLMSSLAKSLPGDYKYSWQKGLIVRSTGEPITKNPDEIAGVILGKGRTAADLDSVESMISAIRGDKSRIRKLNELIVRLRSSEGKKPGEAKSDAEEADRITAALALLG